MRWCALFCVLFPINIFSATTERRKKEKKKKECLLASEVEGCVKVLQTKILPEAKRGVEIFV